MSSVLPVAADSRPGGYVASLDGLRAVAVALVIAFHLSVPYLAPGFAGVDVFFVLSGYLITAGLLHDVDLRGRPRFGRFWERRFRRLWPAVTLVLLAVVAYAAWFAPFFKREELAGDVIWSSFYLANWHFMGSNSYFSFDGVASPLLHLWSLAVEEQFYLLWPLLMGLVCLATRRRRVRTWLGWITLALTVASALALALLHQPDATDRAYMGTDTKAFEPLLGALLAIVLTNDGVRDWITARARVIGFTGLVVTVAVLPFLGGPSTFYFQGGALLLSLGVVALIAGLVTASASLLATVLSWRPMAYLGQISYGLYLWHWPWAVWLEVAHRAEFRALRAPAALAATILCAVLSYHLVEQPIRRGGLSRVLRGWKLAAAVVTTMALVVGGAVTVRAVARPEGTRVLVVGDSVPLRMMTSFDAVAREKDFTVDSAARGGCSPLAVRQQEYEHPGHTPADEDCQTVAEEQRDKVASMDPTIVFWWSRYEVNQRWQGDRLLTPDTEEFWAAQKEALGEAVDRLTSGGARLVIGLTERPGKGMETRCRPDNCHPLLRILTDEDQYRQRWNSIVTEVAATDSRVRTVDMDPMMCPGGPATGLCADTYPEGLLRPDGSHVDVDHFGLTTAETVLEEVLRVGS